jgi:thiamine kinase
MEDISSILRAVPNLADIHQQELLNDGVVNEVWRLDTAEGSYVLRRDKPLAKKIGLNRGEELQILAAAAAAGLGPEPVWCDADAGLLLVKYLAGKPLAEKDISGGQALEAVSVLLHKLHSCRPEIRQVDYAGYVDRYRRATDHPDRERIAAEALSLINRWCNDQPRYVFCHTDPVAGNFVACDDGILRLIDWEYAGLGEPVFDLAVFIRHHGLDQEAIEAFCGLADAGEQAARLEGCLALYDHLLALWSMVCCSTDRSG